MLNHSNVETSMTLKCSAILALDHSGFQMIVFLHDGKVNLYLIKSLTLNPTNSWQSEAMHSFHLFFSLLCKLCTKKKLARNRKFKMDM